MTIAIPVSPTASEYAEIGSDLEHNCSTKELAAFHGKFRFNADDALSALAEFAFYLCSARCLRLAGRIDEAGIYEAQCERVYSIDIHPACRW